MVRHFAPALLFVAASLSAQQPPVPIHTNLGTHHRTIGTRVPLAQQYFDQGLRLVYGFNHAEAIRSFTRATELDPACGMCWWGIAYALGPHVNAGMDSASGVQAYQAAQTALSRSSNASAWERAYIRAVAARYAPVPPADRAGLDSAYAREMGAVARTYPDDLDAQALYAEALMDLRPWNYWTPDGKPYPRRTRSCGAWNGSSPGIRSIPAPVTTISTPWRR